MMDDVLREAERLFLQQEYGAAVAFIRLAEPTEDKQWQAERRRFLAWALLAQGPFCPYFLRPPQRET